MRHWIASTLVVFFLLSPWASQAAGKKITGDFVVIKVKGNVVTAKNKATGTRLNLEVSERTTILHQGEHPRTLADIEKGAEFSGEYLIDPDRKYLATRIDLK